MPLNLEPVQSGYNLSVINDNFQRIEDTWDEKLDRLTSTQNNYMEQELDMNSNHIINHPAPQEETDLVRLKELKQLIIDADVEGVLPLQQPRQKGDGVSVLFSAPNTEETSPLGMFVRIDGVMQRPYTDFSVEAAGVISFNEAPPINSDIDITYFEPKTIEFNVSPTNLTNSQFISDGVQTSFPVGTVIATSETVFLFIDGIKQKPTADYNVVGSNVVLSEAPPMFSDIDITVFQATQV